jgi:predicted RNase H-like HicB family nuclease
MLLYINLKIWKMKRIGGFMETKKYLYYQEDNMFIGWLDEFPDYKTQGATLDELMVNLKDMYEELTGGSIPNDIHVGELRVA